MGGHKRQYRVLHSPVRGAIQGCSCWITVLYSLGGTPGFIGDPGSRNIIGSRTSARYGFLFVPLDTSYGTLECTWGNERSTGVRRRITVPVHTMVFPSFM